MGPLLIAIGAAAAFLIAYHTYGRWLARRVFALSPDAVCPSQRLEDGTDYVPTSQGDRVWTPLHVNRRHWADRRPGDRGDVGMAPGVAVGLVRVDLSSGRSTISAPWS